MPESEDEPGLLALDRSFVLSRPGPSRGFTRYNPWRNPFDFWTKGVGLAHAFRFVD